jgi:hypothetical protein
MAVKIVRLMSGEEIIASVEETKTSVTLKDPSVLIPSPEGKLLLAKWLPYANVEDGIDLLKSHVVFMVDAQKDLEDHYTNVVVNNLVIPGKKVIDPSANLKLSV